MPAKAVHHDRRLPMVALWGNLPQNLTNLHSSWEKNLSIMLLGPKATTVYRKSSL